MRRELRIVETWRRRIGKNSAVKSVALWLVAISSVVAAQAHPKLSSGPMLGYAEMTEVAVWVQTTENARVQLNYWPKANPLVVRSTEVIRTLPSGDHIARFTITGLESGTRYAYRLLIDSTEVPRPYPLEFQTQPHWRYTSGPPTFKIALGSCAYMNEPKFDRPGAPYGGDPEIMTAIAAQKPDLMLWLGDNIYYREPDWLTEAAMRYRWRTDRRLPELQPLLAAAPQYAIWDDHDFGPNDSDRSFRLRGASLQVFEDYWPSVVRGTPETKGCFFRFEWGDVEFFMLDDRYWRTPNRYPDGPDKVMFGKAQLQWLKDSLVDSDATFKIVCSGNQMTNPMTFFEAFGRFPGEQKGLFDFIAQAGISGVLFLTGDRHATELLKVTWSGSKYPWYEYTSSPLMSGGGRNDREENNPARVPGTWVTQKRNFGTIDVSGPRNDRKLALQAFDKDGNRLWIHVIRQAEIVPPRER